MEQRLALPERVLMQIEKPARYIGNEVNMVRKNLSEVDVRIAMCFPDVYEIGMSYLGIQILYDMFNRREDVYCERVYSPWPDLDAIMRKEHIPLFSLETQTAISEFDWLAITIQYEMCYTNILQVIDLAGIPLLAKDRTEGASDRDWWRTLYSESGADGGFLRYLLYRRGRDKLRCIA